MDHFPSDFVAEKVQLDVFKNKTQKFKADLKALRRLIVDAFVENEIGHVVYEFKSNCCRDDMKMAYKQIKAELEKRGFKVHGRIDEPTIELLIASRHLSKTDTRWSWFASGGTASNTRSSSPSSMSMSSEVFDELERVKEPTRKLQRRKSSVPPLRLTGVPVMTPTGSRPASTEDHKDVDGSMLMDAETSHREGAADNNNDNDISSLFDKSVTLDLVKRQAITSASKHKRKKGKAKA